MNKQLADGGSKYLDPLMPSAMQHVQLTHGQVLARALAGATVLLCAAVLVLGLIRPSSLQLLLAEDGPIETLTVLLLLSVALLCVYRAWRYRRSAPYPWIAAVLAGAALFLFGAGEEISWGQRLTGWGEASFIAQHNRQGETTIHNLEVGGYNLNKVIFTYLAFLVLGSYLLALPLLAPRSPGLVRWLSRFAVPVPPWWLVGTTLLATALAAGVPSTRRWELVEVVVPVLALCLLLDQGAYGSSPLPASRSVD